MFPSLLIYSLLFSTCQVVEMDLCSLIPHLWLSSDPAVKEGSWWRGKRKKEEREGERPVPAELKELEDPACSGIPSGPGPRCLPSSFLLQDDLPTPHPMFLGCDSLAGGGGRLGRNRKEEEGSHLHCCGGSLWQPLF